MKVETRYSEVEPFNGQGKCQMCSSNKAAHMITLQDTYEDGTVELWMMSAGGGKTWVCTPCLKTMKRYSRY
jgi:hypothetical protein